MGIFEAINIINLHHRDFILRFRNGSWSFSIGGIETAPFDTVDEAMIFMAEEILRDQTYKAQQRKVI